MGNHFIKMMSSAYTASLSKIVGVALFFSSFICLSKAEKSLLRTDDAYTGRRIKENCSDSGKGVQVCTMAGYSPVFVDQCRVFVETHKHDVIECLGSCPCTAERIEAHIKDLEKDGMQDRAIKIIKNYSRILLDGFFKKYNENKSKDGKERRKRSISNIQFAKDMLDEHNKYRSRHGVPPLKLDNKMNAYAQNLAESNAAAGRLAHTPREHRRYGENLAYSGGYPLDGEPKRIVQQWYNEISVYPGHFTRASGHFSQVIWKNSKRLGVGFAQKGNELFVAAVYDPKGNVDGQHAENVPV